MVDPIFKDTFAWFMWLGEAIVGLSMLAGITFLSVGTLLRLYRTLFKKEG